MKTPGFPDGDDLEKWFANLQPAPPSDALMERLEAARPIPAKRRLHLWMTVPLAAAAAIALAFLPDHEPEPKKPEMISHQTADPEILQAVVSRQYLVDLEDLGISDDPEHGPVRLIRTTWLDKIGYAKPGETTPEHSESWIRSEVVPVALPIL